MSWHLLSRDEQILIVSLFVVVAAFGLTFSAELNGNFQPGITGQLIEPCGDGFCSANEYTSQACPADCRTSPAPALPPGYCGDTVCERWEQGICGADC